MVFVSDTCAEDPAERALFELGFTIARERPATTKELRLDALASEQEAEIEEIQQDLRTGDLRIEELELDRALRIVAHAEVVGHNAELLREVERLNSQLRAWERAHAFGADVALCREIV